VATKDEVVIVIAEGVNSSPDNIRVTKLLSENGYTSRVQRRLLANNINYHFWTKLEKTLTPWLTPANTDRDQFVNGVIDKVERRKPRRKKSGDQPPP